MNLLREKFKSSPVYPRVAPFVIFYLLTIGQGLIGEDGQYWIYLAKTLVGAWLLWEMRPYVAEMRWAFSWEAAVVGVAIFVMWVGIDPYIPHLKTTGPQWDALADYSGNPGMGWMFNGARILGMALVVPPLEEVFWRSFLYRWFVRTDFESMPLGRFHLTSFVITSVLFGFEHTQWISGILCGLAFQWLVIRKNRLGDAISAHAITNGLLGVYVCWRGAWQFF
jgi:CAAX prenyl protease-like protein